MKKWILYEASKKIWRFVLMANSLYTWNKKMTTMKQNHLPNSPFSGNVCSIQRGRMVYFQIVQYATLFVAHETVIKKNAGFGTPLEEFMLPGTWKPTLLLNGWKSWFPTLAKYLVIQFVTFLGWWVHVTLSRGENVTSNDRGWKGHELNHLVKMCFIIQLKQPLVSCPYKLTQMTKNFLFGWYNWHKLRQLRLKFLKPPSVVFNPVVNPFPDAFVNSHHQLDYWTPEDFIQFTPKFQVDKWPNIFGKVTTRENQPIFSLNTMIRKGSSP